MAEMSLGPILQNISNTIHQHDEHCHHDHILNDVVEFDTSFSEYEKLFDIDMHEIQLDDLKHGMFFYALNDGMLSSYILDGEIKTRDRAEYLTSVKDLEEDTVFVDVYRLGQDKKFVLVQSAVCPEVLLASGELQAGDIILLCSVGTREPIGNIDGTTFIDPHGLYFIGPSYSSVLDYTAEMDEDEEDGDADEDQEEEDEMTFNPATPMVLYLSQYEDAIQICKEQISIMDQL